MTHDTEWPASELNIGHDRSPIGADRLAWCIAYLANEAHQSGFKDVARALNNINKWQTHFEITKAQK